MRTKKSWLNIFSFSLLMTAMPSFAFEQSNKEECDRIYHGQVEDLRDLVVKANINKNDTRDNASASEFTTKQQEFLTAITGEVVCRSGKFTSRAKARLYQDDSTIMTSAHIFVDKTNPQVKGNLRRINEGALPTCTFASKANPEDLITLKLENSSQYKFGTMDPMNETEDDFAFVRLSRPVEAKWIPKFGTGPQPGETLHLVTTDAKGSNRQIDPTQLVIQKCQYQTDDGTKAGFFSNCSTLPGDSFGIYYAYRSGEWEAVAFHVASGLESANGLDFDITNTDVKQRSFSLGSAFTTKFTLDGIEFQRRSSGQADAAGGRKINSVPPKKS